MAPRSSDAIASAVGENERASSLQQGRTIYIPGAAISGLALLPLHSSYFFYYYKDSREPWICTMHAPPFTPLSFGGICTLTFSISLVQCSFDIGCPIGVKSSPRRRRRRRWLLFETLPRVLALVESRPILFLCKVFRTHCLKSYGGGLAS